MRKNLLLTYLLTIIATIGMAQTTSFPITLTSADGLPGTEVPGNTGVYIYKTPVYTLDHAITTLRYTVAQTLSSTKLPDNSESYQGRMTWGPGFPFFSISEMTVYDGDGNVIEYAAISNAEHPTDGGGLSSINDGIRQSGNHFHSNWEVGAIDDDYHYIELEFIDEVQSFQIEWSTRYGYPHNQPVYVGLTEGSQSYWPMPEQGLKVEKISTLEELAKPNSLFVIEGHVEAWWDESRQRENIGGGFFEAPCLTTKEPSAFGVFTLIPVEDAENTYKVEYINNDHYIVKRGSNTGFIDWTMDLRKAMEIQFAQHDEVSGDFTLTSNNGELLLMQDAVMRMGCLKNEAEEIAKFERPYATNFSIYKADIKASTILYKLEDAIANADSCVAEYGTSLDEYDEDGFKKAFEAALTSAKAVAAKGEAVTVDEILGSRNELNKAYSDFYALTLYKWADSVSAIIDAIDQELILTSSAPDWINNSYPAEYKETLILALDDAEIAAGSYVTTGDIDDAVNKVKAVIDAFWASKITNVKSLPFRIGTKEDGLPGEKYSDDVNRWESPTYYLTEMVDQLRFTVFATLSGRIYQGIPHPAIIEFELYDENGLKIELTEESFYSNSVSPTWGWGYKALCDGDYSLASRFESITGADQGDFDGSEYVYLDVELPREIGGFKFVLYGRGGNAYQDGPIDFVFGYAGDPVTPATVLFPDDYNAVRGSQIETVEEITDNGIYAIYGLLGCSPAVGGDPENGGFYTSSKRWTGALQSPCAFSIRSTGDGDGTYYIQSLADGTYWASLKGTRTDNYYWTSGSATISKSKAGKFKIEPNNNDENLPYSFVIYEYIEDSYRDLEVFDDAGDSTMLVKTQCPYVIVQDWGSGLGMFPVNALENNDKDGEGEWFIYRMSMDTPYSYWLANMTNSLVALNLVESNDPGAYKDLASFPATCVKAQATAEAKDEAASKAMLATLEAAFAEIENTATNPVVAGYYVIEANQPLYMENQGVKKAIYAMDPHEGCVSDGTFCEELEVGWKDAPEDIMKADSVYVFQLIPAAADEQVALWIEDTLITEEQAQYAYYIKSVKYDKYVSCTDPSIAFEGKEEYISWYGIHISLSDTPQPFMVLERERTAFDLWVPGGGEFNEGENGNLCLHAQGHNSGNGKDGHIVYWKRGDANSLWNLRFIGDSYTSIEAPVVEGADVVSTTYYTIDGVASQVPVQGVNIVKYVYSNGVVKTVKVLK